ncbi:MAG: DUF933 domain-containing protein [Endomicrobiia bacterium]|nr:DUF933 domain-containing protein [Endomicrobiia bacterium]
MEIGIIGLPNVGKTSLFNLLTLDAAQTGNFPFTTIEPNVGVAAVSGDERLARLGEIYRPEKLLPATVRFVDVAGLVKNAHKGEGLGNTFLSHIRPLDAVAHVLREFDSKDVAPSGGSDDERATVETELLLADMDYAERARRKIVTAARIGDKTSAESAAFLDALIARLRKGEAVDGAALPGAHPSAHYRARDFLTGKPRFFVINSTAPFRFPPSSADGAVRIDVKLETEALEIPPAERAKFLSEYGIERPAAERVVAEAARMLDLITFYTVVGKEVRARHIKKGSRALDAAAGIHTDMAKGFIKAEVLSCGQLFSAGSEKDARARGFLRAEGREYTVEDGDIIKIHFRV